MNSITELNMNKLTDAVNKISTASKNLADAASEHKKSIAIVVSAVTGLAVVATTVYTITKMNKNTYTPVHTNKKCTCDKEKS